MRCFEYKLIEREGRYPDVYMKIEYAATDLAKLWSSEWSNGVMDIKEQLKIIRETALALQACADKDIYHRNVQPRMIALSADLQTYKLAYFHDSILLPEGKKRNEVKGNYRYHAPE